MNMTACDKLIMHSPDNAYDAGERVSNKENTTLAI
jgi:hypothetical protein